MRCILISLKILFKLYKCRLDFYSEKWNKDTNIKKMKVTEPVLFLISIGPLISK